MGFIIILLLVVVIIQLFVIIGRLPVLPERDYVAEAMERDRIMRERKKLKDSNGGQT